MGVRRLWEYQQITCNLGVTAVIYSGVMNKQERRFTARQQGLHKFNANMRKQIKVY